MRLIIHKNFIFSLLAGIFLAISLPNFYIPFAFIIGYFLFFKFINEEKRLIKLVFYSFITGFVFNIISFYWILYAISHYGGVNSLISKLILIIFSFILSTYFVISAILQKFLIKKYGVNGFFLAPFIIVFLEISKEFFPFSGFPWNLNGYMLSYIGSIINLSSILSIYGLSFIVLLISAIFFIANERKSIALLSIGFLLFLAIVLFPEKNVFSFEKKYKIAVLQGNINESIKQRQSNNKYWKQVSNIYINLIREASKEKPDLIVLPESALPFDFLKDSIMKDYFLQKTKNIKIPMLIGFDTLDFNSKPPKLFNTVILLDKDKNIVGIYHKVKLVPFGEYTPFPFIIFSKIFPYLQGYDFSPGQKTNLLKHKGLSIATLICFEAIFPNFVANFAKNANLIVNVSNDAWFGKTSAPFQHLEMARVRAVETGRYLIRATNTGFSAIIAPNGKFEKVSELFKKQILIGEVFTSKENTFWVSYKNFVIVLFLLSFFALIFILEKRKKRPLPPQIFKNS